MLASLISKPKHVVYLRRVLKIETVTVVECIDNVHSGTLLVTAEPSNSHTTSQMFLGDAGISTLQNPVRLGILTVFTRAQSKRVTNFTHRILRHRYPAYEPVPVPRVLDSN